MKGIVKIRYPFLVLLLLCMAGIGGTAYFYTWNRYEDQKIKNRQLEEQLHQAEIKEKENLITQRISSQMEEIAYQQKEISDQQRQEAIHQTQIADQMRQHAEAEREKAILAGNAAIESYNQMEEQKRIAELRREEAIQAQMRADTLAKLSLGRSLASEALTQFNTGNEELARLLALASWNFTERYGGDIFQSAVFDALATVSSLSKQWKVHQSAVRDLLMIELNHRNYLLSASQYGEIYLWKPEQNSILMQHRLINNPQLDFRNLLQNPDDGTLYALSFDGQIYAIPQDKLLEISQGKLNNGNAFPIFRIPASGCFGLAWWDGALYTGCRTGAIYRLYPESGKCSLFYQHPAPISTLLCYQNRLLVGDNQGAIYAIDLSGKAEQIEPAYGQAVSYLGTNPTENRLTAGYKNGLLRLIRQDLPDEEFIGHVSPISRACLFNHTMVSCSYDGSVRLWAGNDQTQKVSSAIIYQSTSWIHAMVIDSPNEQLYIGDESGSLAVISISPQQMAEEIRQHLTREFTPEEWDYYIGELSAYETLKGRNRK